MRPRREIPPRVVYICYLRFAIVFKVARMKIAARNLRSASEHVAGAGRCENTAGIHLVSVLPLFPVRAAHTRRRFSSRARPRAPCPLRPPLPPPVPANFTRVANNVLCSARLRPAPGAVSSLLVMLMTFARMWVIISWSETRARTRAHTMLTRFVTVKVTERDVTAH